MEEFEIGDPVWAKMKGYPPWPAKVAAPPPDAKTPKNKHFVCFFGSNDCAWIPDIHITHHTDQRLKNSAKKKITVPLQNAIDALVSYSKSYKGILQKDTNLTKLPTQNLTSSKVKRGKNTDEIIKDKRGTTKKHKRSLRDLDGGATYPPSTSGSSNFEDKIVEQSVMKGKEKPFRDLDGGATYPPSTSGASNFRDKKSDISDVLDDVPVYASLVSNDSSRKRCSSCFQNTQSSLKFGFIGLGAMGQNIVFNLIESGHDITVWNRTEQRCDFFWKLGAKRARSPADLIVNCDVTFCCVSNPDAVKAILFGAEGVLVGLEEASKLVKSRRGFINMTTTDPDTSINFAEAVTNKHGLYLEAPVCGTILDASNGTLLVLASGDKALFSDCKSCFNAIGRVVYYMGADYGESNTHALIQSMYHGTVCVTLAEVMAFIERQKWRHEDFLDAIANGPHMPAIHEKAKMMANMTFRRETALKHVKKDMDMGLMLANSLCQPMPVTSAANEVLKNARVRRYSEDDISAVYRILK